MQGINISKQQRHGPVWFILKMVLKEQPIHKHCINLRPSTPSKLSPYEVSQGTCQEWEALVISSQCYKHFPGVKWNRQENNRCRDRKGRTKPCVVICTYYILNDKNKTQSYLPFKKFLIWLIQYVPYFPHTIFKGAFFKVIKHLLHPKHEIL